MQSLLDLDVRTPQGHTALSLAAFKGHVECVDILISQGASMMLKDYTHKRSAVHSAGQPHTRLSRSLNTAHIIHSPLPLPLAGFVELFN